MYVERAAEGANEADGPLSSRCLGAGELLQAPPFPRRRLVLAALGPRSLRDVHVAARVGDHAVRRDEFARLLPGELPAEARDLLAFGIEHGDAGAEIRHRLVDGQAMAELAHVERPPVL